MAICEHQKYAKGEQVYVYSNSTQKWMDSVIDEIAMSDGMIDGYRAPCGTVKVSFNKGTKFLQPEKIPCELRKRWTNGETLMVYSTSKKEWAKGVVINAVASDCVLDGYRVNRGAVLVESQFGRKWVLPDQTEVVLQRIGHPASNECAADEKGYRPVIGNLSNTGLVRPPNVTNIEDCVGNDLKDTAGFANADNRDAMALAQEVGQIIMKDNDTGCAHEIHGSYDWLRKANRDEDRRSRKEIASITIAACLNNGYTIAGHHCTLQHIRSMIDGTRFVHACDVSIQLGSRQTVWKAHDIGQVLPLAMQLSNTGHRVAVVNAASAYHVGGGFNTGGRHALEESLSTATTLFQSLSVASELALREGIAAPVCARPCRPREGGAWQCHIPEDGVVLSPHVEIFRGETCDGYPFQLSPTQLAAVVSVAMPNCNPCINDAPCDKPDSPEEYARLIQNKFVAVLGAARLAGANVVVMPDAGCGVYGNNPSEVGRLFGEVVQNRFKGTFDEIHLVGVPEFVASAQATGCNNNA